MRKWGIITAILILVFGFKLHFEQSTQGTEKVAFTDAAKNEVVQVCNDKGVPIAYYRDVFQYPCVDSVCERMQVRIYWDIWGHFLRLALPGSQELTKIGHVPFSTRDYNRLHKLLNNPISNVQFYDLEHLTEKESEHAYYSLDGMTGATITEVKYETVKGAVKTCYALWHIIYDEELISQMRSNTLSTLNNSASKEAVGKAVNELSEMAKMINEGIVVTDTYLTQKFSSDMDDACYWACILELARNTEEPNKTLRKCLAVKSSDKNSLGNYALYNFMQQYNIKNKWSRNFEISYSGIVY